MKTSPKNIAIIISVFATVLFAIVLLLAPVLYLKHDILVSIFIILALFIIIYVFNNYILNAFFYEKIKPIYKNIHDFKVSEIRLNDDFEEINIRDINEDGIDWVEKKTNEISQLKKLAKYRKEFLGNVSHELKTPIFNIQGYVLTLLDGAVDDPKFKYKYLEKTEKSIDRMISIVNDLEAISGLESGELLLEKERFNINKLIDEVIDTHELRAKKFNISIITKYQKDNRIYVKADKKRIFQVLSNLLLNSINYGKTNGKTEISILDMNDNILIEMSDNGIGIAKSNIPRLFERFFRVDKSRSRDKGGTGLGLAIVKHIIEAHSQTINVRSTINVGTSFVFTLEKA
ncbi:MAG: ATP-binding protein [Bacteroidales bacterium]|jgi:two-component system phosphate regulon sensor histidine kinase PhoR|nr:ATP-binding protein [Bacteroidales bacterium]